MYFYTYILVCLWLKPCRSPGTILCNRIRTGTNVWLFMPIQNQCRFAPALLLEKEIFWARSREIVLRGVAQQEFHSLCKHSFTY
jgi:hypothetical protein